MNRSRITFPTRGAAAPAPRAAWLEAGEEPSLAEVLADPLVHLVMRRDGVSRSQLETVIARARARRRGAACCRCAA
jgi:hypothetical protein